jgi:predicted  nucleic acid-binding Zn-ribbon protein
MPHECTECGRAFDDGSKEMLSGCPDCGGTTFQFRPEGETPEDADTPPDPPDPEVDGMARTVGNAASAVRNLVSGGRSEAPGETSEPARSSSEPTSRSDGVAAGVSGTNPTGDTGPTVEKTDDSEQTVGETDDPEHTVGETDDPEHTVGETGGVGTSTEESDGPSSTVGKTDESSGVTSTASADSGSEATEQDPADAVVEDATGDERQLTGTVPEGSAQSDARTDIVEADELSASAESPPDRPPVPDPRPLSVRPDEDAETGGEGDAETDEDATVGHDDGERPSLSELRAELNDQFESIRVVEPGQYELNLMELYDREEYIVALQEDGKYTVQLPEGWDE